MEWIDITGYEGYYQVSNMGDVRSIERVVEKSNGTINRYKSRILSPRDNGNGYLTIVLCVKSKKKTAHIHRLVAEHFIQNFDTNKTVVNHKDFDKSNNSVQNLEWCTQYQNIWHSKNNGRCLIGEKIKWSKLKEYQIIEIKKKYKRGVTGCGYTAIAKEYGVNMSSIHAIINNKSWKSISTK